MPSTRTLGGDPGRAATIEYNRTFVEEATAICLGWKGSRDAWARARERPLRVRRAQGGGGNIATAS